jgi:hypothetical protein
MAVTRLRIFDPITSLALAVLVCVMAPGAALAQTGAAPGAALAQTGAAPDAPAQPAAPAREIPPPDQLEPGVNTTPAMPAPARVSPDKPAAGGAARPADAASAPRSARSGDSAAAPAKAAAPKAAKGPDRLQLDTTAITGNRELPKVLYIVPWKRSDLGDLAGRPVNSLLDEVLQPLDRDVFRRENRYYDALKSDATTAVGPPPGSGSRP